jgi:PIN domain nuclease of toxin-antitoxin system
MQILADTHVVLWWLSDDKRLGSIARAALASADNTIYFSAISTTEIAIKRGLGKLRVPNNILEEVRKVSFETIMYDHQAADTINRLPKLEWRDPFDMMLIAQSIATRSVLLTADSNILRAKVEQLNVLDARK